MKKDHSRHSKRFQSKNQIKYNIISDKGLIDIIDRKF